MNTSWPTLTEAVFACEKCRLCQTRTNVVLGEGDLHAPLMFIGEGPGQQEVAAGTIPSIRMGRRRLLNYDSLLEYLAHPVSKETEAQTTGIRRIGV